MARAGTLLVLFLASYAAVLAAASDCSRTGLKVHKLKVFEQGKGLHNVTRVFGISNMPRKLGEGSVITSVLTKTDDPNSQFAGYITGLAVCTSDTMQSEILTVIFKGSADEDSSLETKLFLMGTLTGKTGNQDYAVIGGTRQLTGAHGLVSFTLAACYGCRWMQGTVFVPDLSCVTANSFLTF